MQPATFPQNQLFYPDCGIDFTGMNLEQMKSAWAMYRPPHMVDWSIGESAAEFFENLHSGNVIPQQIKLLMLPLIQKYVDNNYVVTRDSDENSLLELDLLFCTMLWYTLPKTY